MGIVKIIKLRREAKGCSPDRHQSNQRSRITLKLRVPAQGPNALATPSGPGVPVSGRNQAPHIPQENITKCDWCAVSMSYIFCPRPLSLMFFSPSLGGLIYTYLYRRNIAEDTFPIRASVSGFFLLVQSPFLKPGVSISLWFLCVTENQDLELRAAIRSPTQAISDLLYFVCQML